MVIQKKSPKKVRKVYREAIYLLQPTQLLLIFIGFLVFLIGASSAVVSRSALENLQTVDKEDIPLQESSLIQDATPTHTPTPTLTAE